MNNIKINIKIQTEGAETSQHCQLMVPRVLLDARIGGPEAEVIDLLRPYIRSMLEEVLA